MEKKPESTKPKTRQCTHIKANGIRCGSPALKNEYFCYFHTDVVKEVRRPPQRLTPMSVLEDRYAVQRSIMETLYMISTEQIPVRHASVMARLLDLAVRNGRHLEFDSEDARAKMVTELPDYERQFYVEHPTCSPPEGMFDNGREAPGEDPPPKKPVQAVQAAETEKVTA